METDAKYASKISAVTLSLSTMFPLSSTKGPIIVLDLDFEPAYLKNGSMFMFFAIFYSNLLFASLIAFVLLFSTFL